MRLRDYQDLINRAIPIIEKLTISQQSVPNYPGIYQVVNVQKFLRIIEELKQAHLFSDELSRIMEIPNLNNSIENTITINNQNKSTLTSLRSDLLSSARLLQKALKEILTDEDENVLNLKLPNEYFSIKDYITFFTELESICYPFNYIQQEIAIINFDVGSQWIGIQFPDSISAGFFVSLANKSADLFNKILESRKLISEIEKNKSEQTAANIKALDTTIDIINKTQEKEFEDYKEQLIQEAIAESKFILKDGVNKNEFDNFVRIALEKLGSLLIKGMEIVPALNAKPEVKKLTQNANKNIEEKRKLIISCDNQKFLTMLNTNINTKNIPADTVEINDKE